MDWDETCQKIIDYIEERLQQREEPIQGDAIAKMAGCSFDFFQKVFSYLNGITLAEYVRARKMTLAGYALKSTGLRVVDISYRFGYLSPTSFTKAFQQFHGVTPKEARKPSVKLAITPKMQTFERPVFSWRVEEKPSMRLVGKSTPFSPGDPALSARIPAFWSECQKNGVFAQLFSLDEGSPKGMFGAFMPSGERGEEGRYSILVLSGAELPAGWTQIILPKMTFAVFDCVGAVPRAIQQGWQYLKEEWFVKYPFCHAPGPELEWYSNEGPYGEEHLGQIWIPITQEVR